MQEMTLFEGKNQQPLLGVAGIGVYLRTLRQARGLSLGALALKSGVSKSTLSRWEAGTRRPRTHELDAALTALRAGADERGRLYTALGDAQAVRRLWKESQDESGSANGPGRMAPDNSACPPSLPGDLLRSLRRQRGWTQTRLAQLLGVSQGTVARWEATNDWPRGERLQHLCSTLDVRPDEADALLRWRRSFSDAWANSGHEPVVSVLAVA